MAAPVVVPGEIEARVVVDIVLRRGKVENRGGCGGRTAAAIAASSATAGKQREYENTSNLRPMRKGRMNYFLVTTGLIIFYSSRPLSVLSATPEGHLALK